MSGYFARVSAETPTRLWINNPTDDELRMALAAGAIGCTTNPAYAGGLLTRAPDEVLPSLAEASAETSDEAEAAERRDQEGRCN